MDIDDDEPPAEKGNAKAADKDDDDDEEDEEDNDEMEEVAEAPVKESVFDIWGLKTDRGRQVLFKA